MVESIRYPGARRRRLRLRDLEVFMAVAEAGGMRKAAARLHLSQSAVSKAVAALEAAMGATLLERAARGVAPTAYGTALLARGVALFDEIEQAYSDIAHLSDPSRGELRIGCTETVSAGLAAAAIDQLSCRYQQARFHVESGDAPILLDHFLRGRRCELVIARSFAAQPADDLRFEPLFREQLRVVAGVESPWARKRKIRLADLRDAPWIISANEAAPDSPILNAFGAAGISLKAACVLTGSLNLRYGLLSTGRFVTVAPHSLLRFGSYRGRLKELAIALPRWREPTSLITVRGRTPSPLAREFVEVVRQLSRPLAEP